MPRGLSEVPIRIQLERSGPQWRFGEELMPIKAPASSMLGKQASPRQGAQHMSIEGKGRHVAAPPEILLIAAIEH